MEPHKTHTVKHITLLLDWDLSWKFFGNKIMSLFLLLLTYFYFMHVTNSTEKHPKTIIVILHNQFRTSTVLKRPFQPKEINRDTF